MGEIQWSFLTFTELHRHQLYALLRLRQRVFVVEQGCVYLDADSLDQYSLHVLGYDSQEPGGDDALLACARIVAPAKRIAEPSIGRVAVAPAARGQNLGRELMRQSLGFARRHYPNAALRLSAQSHLEAFYGEFGFRRASAPYDEDGIPHIEMLKGQAEGIAEG